VVPALAYAHQVITAQVLSTNRYACTAHLRSKMDFGLRQREQLTLLECELDQLATNQLLRQHAPTCTQHPKTLCAMPIARRPLATKLDECHMRWRQLNPIPVYPGMAGGAEELVLAREITVPWRRRWRQTRQ
jgi:hypothetical protein